MFINVSDTGEQAVTSGNPTTAYQSGQLRPEGFLGTRLLCDGERRLHWL